MTINFVLEKENEEGTCKTEAVFPDVFENCPDRFCLEFVWNQLVTLDIVYTFQGVLI